ncbi:MAG: hypothetical protein AAGA46_00305 [Cyanobacteria bacterium P01_F01_bin.13]
MAEKIADVLKAAKLIAEKGEFIQGDIKIKPYPDGKVRIFGLTKGNGPDVLLAGDALSSDAEDAKKATNFFSEAKIEAMLKAVVGFAENLASNQVKTPAAKTAAPSS